MERRKFIQYIAGASAAGAAGFLTYKMATDPESGPGKLFSKRKKYNVILISIDCLNRRQFSDAMAEGTMPALSGFHHKCIDFTFGHAHAPWTTPSHMSMFTGLYPRQHGRDIPYPAMLKTFVAYDRKPTFKTIADILSSYGYDTAAFTGNGSISGRYGLSQGFKLYMESAKDSDKTDLPETMANFKKWFSSPSRPENFFLFFHTYDFHDILPLLSGFGTQKERDDRVLKYIDGYLKQLFETLDSGNALDNSIVFITGDHGSHMINTGGKCCIHGSGHYEENLKVPMLLKLPGAAEFKKNDAMARHIDILPTILDLIGISSDSYKGPGMSLIRRFREDGKPGSFPEHSFSEADAYLKLRYAITDRNFKYIYSPMNSDNYYMIIAGSTDSGGRTCDEYVPEEELFDIANDPAESNNLLRYKLLGDAVDKLKYFRTIMEEHLNLPVFYEHKLGLMKQLNKMSPVDKKKHLESLKNLGYIR